jgi:hypothetical protein
MFAVSYCTVEADGEIQPSVDLALWSNAADAATPLTVQTRLEAEQDYGFMVTGQQA